MKYRLKISFSTKDNSEYLHLYPLHIDNKNKRIGISQCIYKKQAIGTFLIDFLNTDFNDKKIAKEYFDTFACYFTKYNYKVSYYKFISNYETILKDTINQFKIIQNDIKNLINLEYIETIFPLLTKKELDEKAEELSLKIKKNFYIYNFYYLGSSFSSIRLDFRINKSIASSTHSFAYSYTTDKFIDLLLISIFELGRTYKHFRIQTCLNCGKYFFPKTAHKTLYCDNIFENNKTCKECASNIAYEKTINNDSLLRKYRNKYKNLNKSLSTSNNPKFWDLYESFKEDGPYYVEKYKHGIISAEEFEKWIDSMRIKK